MQSKPAFHLFIALFSLITFSLPARAQTDSIPPPDSIGEIVTDTSLTADSIAKTDSTAKQKSYLSEDAIESTVNYKAKDTIKYNFAASKVYLYGDAVVTYENIELKAEYIELHMDSNTVYAKGLPDSTGKVIGSPQFKEGEKTFNSQSIRYNFQTKKGKITEVITQEGEGYVHAEKVKKTADNVAYMEDGRYTTCDLEDPHYSISAKKMKIIPDDKIIVRPANLVIEDVPTPILVPFGIFPNRKGGKSGFKLPVPGESVADGFYLWNLAYYLYINERSELLFEGDVYSKGSYAIRPTYRYKTKYKRSGTLNFRHKRTVNGVIQEDPNYSVFKDYWVVWNHKQEPQAHPNSNFSANVDMGTANSFRNDINTSDQGYLTNNFASNVRYSKYMLQKKVNLSLNGRHSQNNSDSTFNLLLPEGNISVTRLYPFKTASAVRERWYHKIGISYSGNFRNELSMKNRNFAMDKRDTILNSFRNGVSHSIPVSMNFKVLKYFTVTPAASYREVWSFQSLQRTWEIPDTIDPNEYPNAARFGRPVDNYKPYFARAGNYDASVNMSTKVYGMMQSNSGYFRAFRHVLTPNVGFTYSPEYREDIRTYQDSIGREQEYSILDGSVYGSPGGRESGRIGFSLINSFEMKVRPKTDTSDELRKVKILENLQISSSYDLIKDSLNWEVVSISGYTNLAKGVQLRIQSSLDPYALDSTGTNVYRVNRFEYDENSKLARLTRATASMSFTFNGGKKKDGEEGDKISTIGRNLGAVDWDIPWSINGNYSIEYSKPLYDARITQSLNGGGEVSVTKNWKVSFNTWFDLEELVISYARVGVHRNLHCWQMSMEWIPIGRNNFYNFQISVRASLLEDLKLEKKSL